MKMQPYFSLMADTTQEFKSFLAAIPVIEALNGDEKIAAIDADGNEGSISPDALFSYIGTLPYKEAVLLVTQASVGNPSISQINNNTGLTFTGDFVSTGTFDIIPSEDFASTDVVDASIQNDNFNVAYTANVSSVSAITLKSAQAGTLTNGLMTKVRLRIRIYTA